MNTNIPENLMANVENKLRDHVKDRKRKIFKTTATAATILFILLPASVFAYDKYTESIMYKQEIDLARENKNITEVNQSFKYKNVDFKIKEIVADDTGMEVIYDVSDPKYSINKITFANKDNEEFDVWGYTTPNSSIDSNKKSFGISLDNTTADYMRNNPVTITINNVVYNDGNSDNFFDNITSIFKSDGDLNVDWNLKMQIPMQQIKDISVNKEYSLDIGTLKINSFKSGVLRSVLDYTFVPKDKSITSINPIFSIRFDNQYIISKGGEFHGTNGGGAYSTMSTPNLPSINEENTGIGGTQEFNSFYYKNLNEIGIKLIGVEATYGFGNSQTFKVDKNNLPQEFDLSGEKIEITSLEEKGDSTTCTVAFDKTNRIYSSFDIYPLTNEQSSLKYNNESIEYKDQTSRDSIYNSLSTKIPNLKEIEKTFLISMDLQEGAISEEVTSESKMPQSGIVEFKVYSATKNLIYDEEEVIVHK